MDTENRNTIPPIPRCISSNFTKLYQRVDREIPAASSQLQARNPVDAVGEPRDFRPTLERGNSGSFLNHP
jgi:hypothetical protein